MSTSRARGFQLICAAIAVLPVMACQHPGAPSRSSLSRVEPVSAVETTRAIERAVRYIETTQDRFGEFQSTVCDRLNRCHVDSTPFITTFVVHSLKGLQDPRVDRMRSRGTAFLESEMLPGGLWRYWTWRAPNVPILQPDLDDTATAAEILLSAGRLKVDNRALIKRNMDVQGRFLTWLQPSEPSLGFDFDPASHLRNRELRPSYQYTRDRGLNLYRYIRRQESGNETDAAVNANVLLFLKEEIPSVCAFLNEAIARDEPSVYYLNAPAVYYLYGRAFANGIKCIEPSGSGITRNLLTMQEPDGSFGSPQKTALALNALLDFHAEGPELGAAARSLLSAQKSDGSWADENFFKESAFCTECRFWRSGALSSAIAVEALLKWRTQ